MEEDGTFEVLPKKEVILIKKEKERLDKYFGGIKEMKGAPQALFVVDPKTEHNAVAEAHRLGIPVFALVDTNCDPDEVDYVIPANDDAIRSVKLIVATMANAVVEAQGGTPIVIEFTDEPLPEERPTRRPQNDRNQRGGRGHAQRQYRPKEAKPQEGEAKAEEAPVKEKPQRAPRKLRTEEPKVEEEKVEVKAALIMEAADNTKVEAGGALAVDRDLFSNYITNKIKNHPNIEVISEEVGEIFSGPLIIASGPLTSDKLSEKIKEMFSEEYFYFFDSVAPIVTSESIDKSIAYLKSRYDKGEASYYNCPMNEEEFKAFYNALITAERVVPHDFELKVFEGCMAVNFRRFLARLTQKTWLHNNQYSYYA